jgi:predicted permease
MLWQHNLKLESYISNMIALDAAKTMNRDRPVSDPPVINSACDMIKSLKIELDFNALTLGLSPKTRKEISKRITFPNSVFYVMLVFSAMACMCLWIKELFPISIIIIAFGLVVGLLYRSFPFECDFREQQHTIKANICNELAAQSKKHFSG